MQKVDKERVAKMGREQRLKHKEDMALPVNRFLNAKNDDGELKYPIAVKLRKYFIDNPDPILDDMRMTNALLHQLRWNKQQSVKYLAQYEADGSGNMKDREGNPLGKDDCYLAHVSCKQNEYGLLSQLRNSIVNKMLPKCDGEIFTFENFNEYVSKVEDLLEKEGHELFPKELKLIEPL